MGVGEAGRERRDNGLVAAAYTAAADVDPRLGERVLSVLAAAGIAAYLQATQRPAPPDRPSAERLYVDHAQVAAAHDRLRAFAGEPGSGASVQSPGAAPAGRAEIDAAFADIVAGYHLSADAPHDPGPVRPVEGGPAGPTQIDLRGFGLAPQEPTLLDAFDSLGAGLPDEDEDERYVPPPPPPLPRVSKYTVAAVAALVVGFVFFLAPGLVPRIDPLLTTLVGVALLLAGAGTLIARMRTGDDDDPGDGAVV
ncbi:hypothetical protein GCM10010124_18840 [Pilimelia terevasa]|uniref:DUF308 domain-containing protein n=1 Tax=Pilimelia terevasa TaxID=53372 RepID=A0A8J3FHL3_9ACTN|nr:DUF308 domain-containing protein [Pilimelia terevasa]GGK26421.1 hypothetical protein GCM10010124_18840 [Pilimelia terevasa]